MGAKEFIDDIKEMIKTKDMKKVNEKYLHPAWEMSKELSIKTKDFVVENTPKVIAASKVAAEKSKELLEKLSKKYAKNDPGDQGKQGSQGNQTNQSFQSTKDQGYKKEDDFNKKDDEQNK
jgi:hypothetical protein